MTETNKSYTENNRTNSRYKGSNYIRSLDSKSLACLGDGGNPDRYSPSEFLIFLSGISPTEFTIEESRSLYKKYRGNPSKLIEEYIRIESDLRAEKGKRPTKRQVLERLSVGR